MTRKAWSPYVGTIGLVLLAAVVVPSCSSKSAPNEGGGDDRATGGTPGGSGGNAVGGASGSGGSGAESPGGAGMSGGTTSSGGTTGGTTGGTASSGGSGGSAAAGGGFACQKTAAACNLISSFPGEAKSGQCWGSGTFYGGVSTFGVTRNPSDAGVLHLTGTVSGYSQGVTLWFGSCSDLSAYSGIGFTIGGTVGTVGMIDLLPWTNSDYPWQAVPADMKGACTAANPALPYGTCLSPSLSVPVPVTPTPTTVTWSQMTGGMPVSWDAASSPGEILQISWQFPWSPSTTPYAVDVTISAVKLSGGTESACEVASCGTFRPAGGGMGGMGGTGQPQTCGYHLHDGACGNCERAACCSQLTACINDATCSSCWSGTMGSTCTSNRAFTDLLRCTIGPDGACLNACRSTDSGTAGPASDPNVQCTHNGDCFGCSRCSGNECLLCVEGPYGCTC